MSYEELRAAWVGAMSAITGGEPSKVRDAQKWMDENLARNQLWNIKIFCELLQDRTQQLSIHRLSASGIRMTLAYRSRGNLEAIRGSWNPEISSLVKGTVMERLLVEDEVLRNQMIFIAAVVFGIETSEKWDDFLPRVGAGLREAFELKQPPVIHAWLTVLKELGYLPNFGDLVERSGGGFMPLMQMLVHLGTEPGDWSIDLRGTSMLVLQRYIEVRPTLLVPANVSPQDASAGLIDFVQRLEVPMTLRNPKLFEVCLQIMLNIVKSFYDQREAFLEKVHYLATLPWTSGFREAPIDFRVYALEFWRYAGIHEAKQLKRARDEHPNANEDALENNSAIVGSLMDPLFPMFVQELMTVKLKPNGEDVDWGTVFYAANALQTFYCSLQGRMGEKILIEVHRLSQEGALEAKIAATQLLWALGDPTDDAYVRKEVADSLIPGPTEFLLRSCGNDQGPHLRFAALRALELLLQLYKDRYARNIVEFLNWLTPIYAETNFERTLPSVLSQQLKVITALTSVFRSAYSGKREAVQSFRLFVDFAKRAMTHCQQLGDDNAPDLYRDAADALCCLVLRSDDQNRVDIEQLFGDIMGMLRGSSGEQMRSSQLAFVVQSQLCSVITMIVSRLGKSITEDKVRMIVDELFKLLSNRNALVYEEALYTLGQIVAKTSVEIPGEILDRMLQIACDSMASRTPEVINSASSLIAETMRASCNVLHERFHGCWNLLQTILREMHDMRSIHAMLIRALAAMLEGSQGDETIFGDISTQENYNKEISNILSQVVTTNWNPESETDAEYMDELLQALGLLHVEYCKLFHPLEGKFQLTSGDERYGKEKEVLLTGFVRYAEICGRLPKPSVNLFWTFAKVARTYGNFTSRRNNVVLNRQAVHKFLKRFESCKYRQVVIRASRETQKFLKSR